MQFVGAAQTEVHPKLKLEQGESMPAETGDSTVMKYQLRL
jgi:hypothetical protein